MKKRNIFRKGIGAMAWMLTGAMLFGCAGTAGGTTGKTAGETAQPVIENPEFTLGQEGDFVTPLSATTDVTVGDGTVEIFDELSDYLRKTEIYNTPKYEEYPSLPVGVSIYYDTADEDGDGVVDSVKRACDQKGYHSFLSAGRNRRDVIVYAINFVGERIGTEDDVSILRDYIDEGYVVLVADFGKNPEAGVPNLEHAMSKLHLHYGSAANMGVAIHNYYFFYLPSGYRLARDVWYWNSYYYSSLGFHDSVIGGWNRCLVKGGSNNHRDYRYSDDFILRYSLVEGIVETKVCGKGELIKEAVNIQDCVRSDGSNLVYDCYLDIVYPSMPKRPTPVYMMAATCPDRNENACDDDRCTYVGMTFSGYTTSLADCVYIPMARSEAYSYIDTYGAHAQSVVKSAQATIRCLRYYADTYGYDGSRIGVGGISKATPTIGPLGCVDNELVPEMAIYDVDKAARAEYGVEAAFEGDIIEGDTRLTLLQPFLYYDVPYGPIYNEDGTVNRDIYGNVITYDYYGKDGVQYLRAASSCDLRARTQDSGRTERCEAAFYQKTDVSIASHYREKIDARQESDTYRDGRFTHIVNRRYGTEDKSLISNVANQHDSFYYYIDTDVDVCYVSAGNGVDRYENANGNNLGAFKKVPALICCGSYDPYGCFDHWYAIRASFGEDAIRPAVDPYFPITMTDKGHTFPTGYDYMLGFWRHDAFLKFFDHFLKPEENAGAELIWVTPVRGNMAASPNAPIELKFYNRADVESVKAGTRLTDADGNAVSGTWRVSEVDTRFTFTPSEPLVRGASYKLTVDSGIVKSAVGEALVESYAGIFAIAEETDSVLPVEDSFVRQNNGSKAMHGDKIYKKVLMVDTKQITYVSFDKAALRDMTHLRFEAVYQSNKEGVSFTISMVDGLKIDEKTLNYDKHPLGVKVGEAELDDCGVGYFPLSALELSGEGFVTFYLESKSDAIYFESLDSAERGCGITAVAK